MHAGEPLHADAVEEPLRAEETLHGEKPLHAGELLNAGKPLDTEASVHANDEEPNSQLPSVKPPTSASLSRTPGAAKTDVRTPGVTTVTEGEKTMHTKTPLLPNDVE